MNKDDSGGPNSKSEEEYKRPDRADVLLEIGSEDRYLRRISSFPIFSEEMLDSLRGWDHNVMQCMMKAYDIKLRSDAAAAILLESTGMSRIEFSRVRNLTDGVMGCGKIMPGDEVIEQRVLEIYADALMILRRMRRSPEVEVGLPFVSKYEWSQISDQEGTKEEKEIEPCEQCLPMMSGCGLKDENKSCGEKLKESVSEDMRYIGWVLSRSWTNTRKIFQKSMDDLKERVKKLVESPSKENAEDALSCVGGMVRSISEIDDSNSIREAGRVLDKVIHRISDFKLIQVDPRGKSHDLLVEDLYSIISEITCDPPSVLDCEDEMRWADAMKDAREVNSICTQMLSDLMSSWTSADVEKWVGDLCEGTARWMNGSTESEEIKGHKLPSESGKQDQKKNQGEESVEDHLRNTLLQDICEQAERIKGSEVFRVLEKYSQDGGPLSEKMSSDQMAEEYQAAMYDDIALVWRTWQGASLLHARNLVQGSMGRSTSSVRTTGSTESQT